MAIFATTRSQEGISDGAILNELLIKAMHDEAVKLTDLTKKLFAFGLILPELQDQETGTDALILNNLE